MAIINISAFAAMIAMNAYANIGRFGGASTGEISEAYRNLFTPAGWTFAIWGAIYLLLLIFTVSAFFKTDSKEVARMAGPWFMISCMFNILWLMTWHSKLIWLSMIMMLGLLISLVVMNMRIYGINSLATAGLRLYIGWISVATLANLCVTLVSFGMDGMGEASQGLTVALLIIAAAVMSIAVLLSRSWIYGAAGTWAIAGIVYRHMSPVLLRGEYPVVATTAMICGIVLAAVTLLTAFRLKPTIPMSLRV